MIASGSYASSCTWLALILAPLFQDAREEAMDAIKRRDFVLRPAAAIARNWRDPESGLTLGQLRARLIKAR